MLAVILNNNPEESKKIKSDLDDLLGEGSSLVVGKESSFIDYLKSNKVGIVFIDTAFIGLTAKIRKIDGKINIIYLSDDDSFKKDAFDYRASGYIIRPISVPKLKLEIANLRYPVSVETQKKLRVQCFGNFDVFTIQGKMLKFSRSKAKELFAYLISRNGTSCTTRELVSILFEEDSESSFNYVQQIISSLGKTFKEYGCEEVLHRTRNALSVDTAYIDCDYYRFLDNDETAKRLYTGDFMMQYEWADYVLAFLDNKSL